jgi:hypothetical protein
MDAVLINVVPAGGYIEVTDLVGSVSDRSLQQSSEVNRVSAWVHRHW